MNALKELQSLDYKLRLKQFPNVPAYAITRANYSDATANGLTRCIIQWLRLNGHYAVRINTTGRMLHGATVTDAIGRTRQMKGKWIPGTTRRGTADIHATINGRHVSIEVKINDRMTPKQHETRKAVEQAGGLYLEARNFEQFITWYKQLKNGTR